MEFERMIDESIKQDFLEVLRLTEKAIRFDTGSAELDEEQLDKVLAVRERTPTLEKIIIFDMEGLRNFDDADVISLDQLLDIFRYHDIAFA